MPLYTLLPWTYHNSDLKNHSSKVCHNFLSWCFGDNCVFCQEIFNFLTVECLNVYFFSCLLHIFGICFTSSGCACDCELLINDEARVTSHVIDMNWFWVYCCRALSDPSLDHGQPIQGSARTTSQSCSCRGKGLGIFIADLLSGEGKCQDRQSTHKEFENFVHI